MTTRDVDTIVVGAGQAGLSTSYFLNRLGVEHLVLEQGRIGESWRRRWDSFTLVSPTAMNALPGPPCAGDPDGYLTRDEVIGYLEKLAESFEPPLRTGTRVTAARPTGSGFVVETSAGSLRCRSLVVAAGTFQKPRIPALAAQLPPDIVQLHSNEYRNPAQLPDGAVLVVGSAQSGAQIADELHAAGRAVYLSVSRAPRAPRRYRGRDIFLWLRDIGFFERTVDDLESPADRFNANAHLSGRDGGKTLDLRRLGRAGVTLLGRVEAALPDGVLRLAADLHANLDAADTGVAELCAKLDAAAGELDIHTPARAGDDGLAAHRGDADEDCVPIDWKPPREPLELRLDEAGIRSIIWATGFNFDFRWVECDVFDEFGYPRQQQGVTAHAGLYFVGLHWLNRFKSGLLYGVAGDAEHVATHAARRARAARGVRDRRPRSSADQQAVIPSN